MKNIWLVIIEKSYPDFFDLDVELYDNKEDALLRAKEICDPPDFSRRDRGRYQCTVKVYFADEVASDGYCIDNK